MNWKKIPIQKPELRRFMGEKSNRKTTSLLVRTLMRKLNDYGDRMLGGNQNETDSRSSR